MGGLTLIFSVGGLTLTVVEVELVEIHAFDEVASSLGFEAGQLGVNILAARETEIKMLQDTQMFIQCYRQVQVL